MTADVAGIAIVMPVLNEAAGIVAALQRLQPLRSRGVEIVVVDGGSSDGTLALAAPLADRAIAARRGRALQMNAGALEARADALLFLHADTVLPEKADAALGAALADKRVQWGRFDVRIAGAHPMLRVIGWSMNWRTRLTGIATGDQAMFVRRTAFETVGGFPEIPLMEDIALSARLKRLGRPRHLRASVVTSGRRWEKNGVWRTMFLMWRLRLAYWLGADPAALAMRYGYRPQRP